MLHSKTFLIFCCFIFLPQHAEKSNFAVWLSSA